MSKDTVVIIKTLPHLHTLFLSNEVSFARVNETSHYPPPKRKGEENLNIDNHKQKNASSSSPSFSKRGLGGVWKPTITAHTFSDSILKTIDSAKFFKKKEITFNLLTELTNQTSRTKSQLEIQNENNDYPEDVTYNRTEKVEELLEFSIRGDIFSIWLPGYEAPVRFEFFGDECEEMYLFDPATGRKVKDLSYICITDVLPKDRGELEEIRVIQSPFERGRDRGMSKFDKSRNLPAGRQGQKTKDSLNNSIDHKDTNDTSPSTFVFSHAQKLIFTNKPIDSIEDYYSEMNLEIIETDFTYPQLFFGKEDLIRKEIEEKKKEGFEVIIQSEHEEFKWSEGEVGQPRLLVNSVGAISLSADQADNRPYKQNLPAGLSAVQAGFISEQERIAFYTDRELFGSVHLSRTNRSAIQSDNLKKLLRQFEGEINPGDIVVHEDYGVGRYEGLEQQEIDHVMNEYLLIKYADDDEIYVPLDQIQKITKYLGPSEAKPKLTKLKGGNWQRQKQKIKKSVELNAKELVEHMAKRELSTSDQIKSGDSEEYQLFVESFEFEETEDQIRAINEIISDLEKEVPMNRLLIGDVGFGKTEVVMRAAFKIIESGGQVAVLAPTTVLAAQHFLTFKERFENSDAKIEMVSRFNSTKKNREIVDAANEGKVDIIIGTHRLLSSDVKFENLQLVVVDEEQKFGVKQKEKIKRINYGVNLLSVSATPIPRTLSMALNSVQDISVITTPPPGRKSVETKIIWQNWEKASNAIQKEIERGGQVYFVHNEVRTIQAIRDKLDGLVNGNSAGRRRIDSSPSGQDRTIQIQFAHGQMSSLELNRIMQDFDNHKFDVLVATSIIENGIDIPNVNTVVINNAHRFGLASLYQIRGRVGRSERNAFCFLMAPRPKTTKSKDIKNPDSLKLINRKDKRSGDQNPYERLHTLVQNQDLGSGFRIAQKDLEIRGAGDVLGKKQHGHISKIGYAMYVEMLATEVERLKSIK